MPLPDSEAVEDDFMSKSTPATSHLNLGFAHSVPTDANNDRRMRSRPVDSVSGHVSQNCGNQSTCVFDNRVYSPDGSTSSRCSDDEEDDDDETLTSSQVSHEIIHDLTCEK